MIGKSTGATEWRDRRTGAEIRVLRPDEKFTDLYRSEQPLSLGRAVLAMVLNDWSGARAEWRALDTSTNPTAAYLVPDPLAATVIDKARALSVLMRDGARTIEMTSSTLMIARVETDATMEVKSENAAFSGSDVVFGALNLVAFTIGTYVTLSRELAADAGNAVELIERCVGPPIFALRQIAPKQ